MTGISMTIDKKWFDKNKESFLEQGKKDGFENPTYSIELDDLEYSESCVEEGRISYTGISDEDDNISLSIWADLELDLAGEVLEYYVKKINKIKTVLEATKD